MLAVNVVRETEWFCGELFPMAAGAAIGNLEAMKSNDLIQASVLRVKFSCNCTRCVRGTRFGSLVSLAGARLHGMQRIPQFSDRGCLD